MTRKKSDPGRVPSYMLDKKPQHQGETVTDFLKRGGKVQKLEPAIADFAITPIILNNFSRKIK